MSVWGIFQDAHLSMKKSQKERFLVDFIIKGDVSNVDFY